METECLECHLGTDVTGSSRETFYVMSYSFEFQGREVLPKVTRCTFIPLQEETPQGLFEDHGLG